MYKELFEKYAKAAQRRAILSIIAGLTSAGLSVWALKEVRADRSSAAR